MTGKGMIEHSGETKKNPFIDPLDEGGLVIYNLCITVSVIASGNSSDGRAPAFQAGCRGFESRFPLHFFYGGNSRGV